MSLSYPHPGDVLSASPPRPKREAVNLSKREQKRLAALRTADLSLQRDMKRLSVRFD